jgi:uncharacterized protein (DUF1330 family)
MLSFVNPSKEQFKQLYGLPETRPIIMLNLIRFVERVVGAVDVDPALVGVSGRVVYERYSNEAEVAFREAGGRQLWIGRPVAGLIGPSDESWDLVFAAWYPSPGAFIRMVKSAAYQQASRYRSAAVADSRLIGSWKLEAGRSFAPVRYGDEGGAEPFS